jgi:AcrR family transcriptional regulator
MEQKNPKASEKDPTKQRILQSALKEFAAHGLAGARVDRIAQSAGVNKAMIYYHFSSKDNLYRETLGEMYGMVMRSISQFAGEHETLEDLLTAVSDYYYFLMTDHAEFRQVLLRELASPRDDMISHIAGIISSSGMPRQLVDRLEQEMAAGHIRQADPRQLLVNFLTLNIGYFLLSPILNKALKIEDSEQFSRDRRREVVTFFLNGIKAD